MEGRSEETEATAATLSFCESGLVRICVGRAPDQKTFGAHQPVLSRSEFFRRALNGNWLKSETRVINMPEDDPQVVDLYLQFVYVKELPGRPHIETVEQVSQEYKAVATVYVLAEKLQDTTTKLCAIRRFHHLAQMANERNEHEAPTSDIVRTIYQGTREGDPMRKLCVDLWLGIANSSLSYHYERVPKEFLKDVIVGLRFHHGVNPEEWGSKTPVEVYINMVQTPGGSHTRQ